MTGIKDQWQTGLDNCKKDKQTKPVVSSDCGQKGTEGGRAYIKDVPIEAMTGNAKFGFSMLGSDNLCSSVLEML